MSDFSLLMVDGQTTKHYGYAVKRENAQNETGAELKNVEYEIVTENTKGDDDSISKWKLENLAVFDMDGKSVVVDEKYLELGVRALHDEFGLDKIEQ